MTTPSSVATMLRRPMPPAKVCALDSTMAGYTFDADAALLEWVRAAFVADTGPLHDAQFAVLKDAHIGCLWAGIENAKNGKRILATAEAPHLQGNRWVKGRQEHQMVQWFGALPDFILTFDALWANDASDREWCAVVDHELRHCRQARDSYGAPKFNQRTGQPLWAIEGHDIEEFQATVERFGLEACGEAAVDFVIAAARPAVITDARIALACGKRDGERNAGVDGAYRSAMTGF